MQESNTVLGLDMFCITKGGDWHDGAGKIPVIIVNLNVKKDGS